MPCLPHLPRFRAILLLAAALLLPQVAAAADVEVREYTIQVDRKQAGQGQMTISRADDGTITMTGSTDVRVTFYVVKTYIYTYRGTEVWKDGRLLRLDSNCTDDGKQFAVQAVAEGKNLRVKVNGQERLSRPDAWLTTYWRLPVAAQRNAALPLIDADTGKDINARLHYVEMNRLTIGGQAQDAAHWRLTGDVQVELWYDAQERLVREEFVEDGHRTTIELVRVRR